MCPGVMEARWRGSERRSEAVEGYACARVRLSAIAVVRWCEAAGGAAWRREAGGGGGAIMQVEIPVRRRVASCAGGIVVSTHHSVVLSPVDASSVAPEEES